MYFSAVAPPPGPFELAPAHGPSLDPKNDGFEWEAPERQLNRPGIAGGRLV